MITILPSIVLTYLLSPFLPRKISVVKFLAITLFAGVGFACQPQYQEAELSYKTKHFNTLVKALEECKSKSKDSVVYCAAQSIDIDTLVSINHDLWHQYTRASAFLHQRLYKESLQTIDEALRKSESELYLFERANLLMLRGLVFTIITEDLSAIEDCYNAAAIYLQLGLYQSAAECYLGMTNIQYGSGNYQHAIENGTMTLDLLHKSSLLNRNDSNRLMNVYNTLGLSFMRYNMPDTALYYFNSSIEIAKKLNDEFWEGLVNGNLATLLISKGQLSEAEAKTKLDVEISLKYKQFGSAAGALLILGDIESIRKNYNKGGQYYDSALVIIRKLKEPKLLTRYYLSVAKFYWAQEDYQKGGGFFQNHIKVRDSLLSVSINDQLQDLQNRKQVEKHLADINLLRVENELKAKQMRIWQLSILASICFLMLLSILFYIKRRSNELLKKANDDLESSIKQRTSELIKTNQELDTYLYRASHDIRRPILSIIGLAKIGELSKGTEADSNDLYIKIAATAKEMDSMLNKLQMAYRLNKMQLEYDQVDLNKLLAEIISDLQKSFSSLVFNVRQNSAAFVVADWKLLNLIFFNLLENACVFRSTNPKVDISIENEPDFVAVKIADNGIGIQEEHLNDVFSLYTRFSQLSMGSGLGLYLVKQAVNKINGSIEVSSVIYKGTKFIIRIPRNEKV